MPDLSAWLEALPSDGSLVGNGARDIRSNMSTLALGLGEWLQYPGSGGGSDTSAGYFKEGAARVFFAAGSASSNSANATLQQRAFLEDNTNDHRLLLYESDTTRCMGGEKVLEHSLTSNNRQWVTVSDFTVIDSTVVNGTLSRNFETWRASSPPVQVMIFGDTPIVNVTSSDTRYFVALSAVTTGGFTSDGSYVGTTSDVTLHWFASGWTDEGNV